MSTKHYETTKESLIEEIKRRQEDKIIEKSNDDLLIKLIDKADDLNEAINIATLGTTYKRTGFHFDKRLEKMDRDIKYFKKNEELSFSDGSDKPANKLIVGDNYEALQNLLIEYKGKVDEIYTELLRVFLTNKELEIIELFPQKNFTVYNQWSVALDLYCKLSDSKVAKIELVGVCYLNGKYLKSIKVTFLEKPKIF